MIHDILEKDIVNYAFRRAIENIKDSLIAAESIVNFEVEEYVGKIIETQYDLEVTKNIKPCPFCGSDEPYISMVYPAGGVEAEEGEANLESFGIECSNNDCGASGPYITSENAVEAIEAWNKRV